MVSNVMRALAEQGVTPRYVSSVTIPNVTVTRDEWSEWVNLPELVGAHGFYGHYISSSDNNYIQSIAYFDENTKCTTTGKYYRTGFVDFEFDSENGNLRFKKLDSSIYMFKTPFYFYIW